MTTQNVSAFDEEQLMVTVGEYIEDVLNMDQRTLINNELYEFTFAYGNLLIAQQEFRAKAALLESRMTELGFPLPDDSNSN